MNKKERLFILFFSALIFSCDVQDEYLKHDLQFEKLGDCNQIQPGINVVANTIGERFSFQQCLDENFDGEYEVERLHDTVLIRFKNPGGQKSLYKIDLDINTRPEYGFLSINGSVYPVRVKRY